MFCLWQCVDICTYQLLLEVLTDKLPRILVSIFFSCLVLVITLPHSLEVLKSFPVCLSVFLFSFSCFSCLISCFCTTVISCVSALVSCNLLDNFISFLFWAFLSFRLQRFSLDYFPFLLSPRYFRVLSACCCQSLLLIKMVCCSFPKALPSVLLSPGSLYISICFYSSRNLNNNILISEVLVFSNISPGVLFSFYLLPFLCFIYPQHDFHSYNVRL